VTKRRFRTQPVVNQKPVDVDFDGKSLTLNPAMQLLLLLFIVAPPMVAEA